MPVLWGGQCRMNSKLINMGSGHSSNLMYCSLCTYTRSSTHWIIIGAESVTFYPAYPNAPIHNGIYKSSMMSITLGHREQGSLLKSCSIHSSLTQADNWVPHCKRGSTPIWWISPVKDYIPATLIHCWGKKEREDQFIQNWIWEN